MKIANILFVVLIIGICSCKMNTTNRITTTDFGSVAGQPVQLFTFTFPDKLVVSVTNYGGIITHLKVPDKQGKLQDIVLGYEELDGYLQATPYFGAIVGRYGNRIANGSFVIDSDTFTLAKNNGPNSLHGGVQGFDKVVWDVQKVFENEKEAGLVLQYVSEHLEEGYPGRLIATVTYTFTESEFQISYQAETDRKTVVNLTQHSYFNLSGNPRNTILDHELELRASQFIPVDSTLIPTGELQRVDETPFDFTNPKAIGVDIDTDDSQIQLGGGFDHCWVIDGEPGSLRSFANVYHADSGITMEVLTTEPGVQFYSGNFLDGSISGKGGVTYQRRSGFCLETQHFPDSPNQPNFPTTLLQPGDRYETETVYRFGVK